MIVLCITAPNIDEDRRHADRLRKRLQLARAAAGLTPIGNVALPLEAFTRYLKRIGVIAFTKKPTRADLRSFAELELIRLCSQREIDSQPGIVHPVAELSQTKARPDAQRCDQRHADYPRPA